MKSRQFCLAMLLALILLTVASAQWSGQQRSGAYDPWLDYNDDGVIDVNELHQIAEAYGSSGEPTRNVTVSSHVTSYIRLSGNPNITIPSSSNWLSEMITVEGYTKVTILIKTSIGANFASWNLYAFDLDGHSWLVDGSSQGNSWVKTYDAMSQRIQIRVSNSNTLSAMTADVGVYLVA